jgi:OPA family sugar phosphate sensor protein UhpC-like MFS transporter
VTVILLGVLHQGLVSFAALWLVHGFFQGFSWPSIVEMTNKWFPPNERGKILAFGGVGGNLAGVCSPALFRVLSMSFGGWRGTFIITGLSGVVISVILAVITRASPMDVNNDKGQNNAHLKFNKKEKISRSSADRVFANSLLWVCVLSTLVLTLSKIFMSDWMQLYFVQDKKWQPEKGG